MANLAANKSKFLQWIDFRVRVTIQDGRMLLGTFLAFDKHLNMVLSETEEFRTIKPKKQGNKYFQSKLYPGEMEKQIKRALGMVILRGDNIISITAEAPPHNAKKVEATSAKQNVQKVSTNQFASLPIQNIMQDPTKGVTNPIMNTPLGMPPSLAQQQQMPGQTPGNVPQNLMQGGLSQNTPRPPNLPPQ